VNFALDSNVIISYVRGSSATQAKVRAALLAGDTMSIPLHAYYEVLRGIEGRNAHKQARLFNELLTVCRLGDATKAVFDEAAHIYNELRRKGVPSDDDMDILIAAFCRTYSLTLVTDNVKDFENISGLTLVAAR
jgi:tRNA(fMet)-specific endonuclease VapC